MDTSSLSLSSLWRKYKPLLLLLFFSFCFFSGGILARFVSSVNVSSTNIQTTHAACENWGLGFQEEGKRPIGNTSIDDLKKYNAYYAQDTSKKILYLTFDCGYENGNTPAILKALKKHHAPATFFVVGNFLQENPDLVKQMLKEGHTVGNHTFHHPDMSQISTRESFAQGT